MSGTTNQVELATGSVRGLAIPCPPVSEQERIVAKVNELMALCDKLEAQQQESEAVCKVTRTTVLNALTEVQSSASLQMAWQRLANAVPILLDNPGSAPELASTIKDLALRGFVTERGPGNAETLLTQAYTEQLRLVEQGKLQRPKGLLPVTNVPYVLPDNWRWARLHQVAEVVDPNPSHRMPTYIAKGVPFISTENFANDDQIDFTIGKQVSKDELAEHISRYDIRDGSFAFSRIGTIGKTCHLPKERSYCISHVLVVISPLTQAIDERYLRLAVSTETILKQAREGVKSIGVPDLGMGKIRNFLLPIPPLEEQVRIVTVVNQFIDLCNRLEASINIAQSTASDLAFASISPITGISFKDEMKMKAPNIELVSNIRVDVSAIIDDQAKLAMILVRNNGELSAKTLWDMSGLDISRFYQQLKTEIANGWIARPEIAYMREVEAR